jgi:long-subunit fatty acid transport protein
MCFREHYAPSRRRQARAVLVGLVLIAPVATAAPLDEPFVGGMSFSGPTSGNVGAIYWNPAALGLARGFQLMVSGSVHRVGIDATRTGMATASARDMAQPFSWPMGPGAFIGLSSDIGGDRFALGFATFMPYLERLTYPISPAGTEPNRYHALALDLRNLALVPALAIRFGSDFRVGFAPGFLFSTGRVAFGEDLALDGGTAGLNNPVCNGMPCGQENPAATARYDIASGNGLGDAKFSVTLGVGVYFRRRSLEFGLSYQSRPLGGDVSGVQVAGDQTTVTLPPRDPMGGGAPLTCPNGDARRCVFGDITYKLPEIWIGGVTWRLRPGLELTAMVRWLRLSAHDRIDIRVTGPTLESHGIPEHVVLYRGFRDVWDTRVRVSYWWRETVRIGAALRMETSAVDARSVNPAAVDGFKLQPIALAEVRIGRKLWLGGGYGFSIMPAVTVTDSAFSPAAAIACADSSGDLNACGDRSAGRARASANGRYTRMAHDFGFTLTARF